jgi:hypothetical protein
LIPVCAGIAGLVLITVITVIIAAGGGGNINGRYDAFSGGQFAGMGYIEINNGILSHWIGPSNAPHIQGRYTRNGNMLTVTTEGGHWAGRGETFTYRIAGNSLFWQRDSREDEFRRR